MTPPEPRGGEGLCVPCSRGVHSCDCLPEAVAEGGDHLLPCDVTVNHITFKKGIRLRTFVEAATRWHTAARDAHPARMPTREEVADTFRKHGLEGFDDLEADILALFHTGETKGPG